jgi:hypothetical protein
VLLIVSSVKTSSYYSGFGIIAVVTMKSMVFWFVRLSSLVKSHGLPLILDPENRGDVFLHNIGAPQKYTVLQLRRQYFA